MIEECRDKQRQAEQERDYALSHQKKVEIPVEKPVLTASLLPNQKKMLSEINAGYGRKGESYHGDISLYSKDCRAQ